MDSLHAPIFVWSGLLRASGTRLATTEPAGETRGPMEYEYRGRIVGARSAEQSVGVILHCNQVYHSEAGLSFAVQLAYYAAQDLYTIVPELDTGKGYADLAFFPLKPDIPALLVEMKYEKDAETAISQIHRQKYPDRLQLFKGNLIMVGINYDRTVSNESMEFKHHSCLIEKA